MANRVRGAASKRRRDKEINRDKAISKDKAAKRDRAAKAVKAIRQAKAAGSVVTDSSRAVPVDARAGSLPIAWRARRAATAIAAAPCTATWTRATRGSRDRR